MDKSTSHKIVKETFENPFSKERFSRFTKELLNRYDESKAFHAHGYVKEGFKKTAGIIKTYERLGTLTDPDNKKIDILIVYLEKENSIDRARTTLRNFVAEYLKQRDMKDAALVAFVSPNVEDWRFSLVRMDYKFEEGKAGKIKVKEDFTPARRWSFLVGKNENSHTAQSRLAPIVADDENNPTLKQLEEAFNIEKVTEEFFEKYRDLFLWTKETLDETIKRDGKVKSDFESKNIDVVNFGKKLLGQIVFLYFLQKKGWFGVARDDDWGTGPKNFLRELFEGKHAKYKNFFNDILEPLFYEALRIDRSHDDDYYSKLNCRIPFLNGGLFDPIGDYDWVHTDILLPNELFSNTQKTKEGDTGNGILDIFDRYNFTVKEDEPLEKEVAVDPEMLGKVFENLLPENLRKGKGTYYTPREIVHFMCQESLANYLATEFREKVSMEDIETLIKYGELVVEHDSRVINKGHETKTYAFKIPQNVRNHAKAIDLKLASVRVCDPAVGSGAFPVGMMNEIVRARNSLTPYVGKDGKRTPYNFKRHAIQNCLYGVDIDLGAVEICKLRFWLSLVVDEDDIKQIKPLPNLDYKIMQGNSLVELLSPELLMQTMDREKNNLIDQLKRTKDEFFNVALPSDKARIRDEIEKLIISIFEYDKKSGAKFLQEKIHGIESQGRLFDDKSWDREDVKKISEIEQEIKKLGNIKLPGPNEHFEWHLNFSDIFKEKGGFDIVIANPPYVRQEKISDKEAIQTSIRNDFPDYFSKNYMDSKSDLYTYFYVRGIRILNQKGIKSFICSNSWLDVGYGAWLQKFLLEKAEINLIIDNSAQRSFESADINTILSFIRALPDEQDLKHLVKFVMLKKPFEEAVTLENIQAIRSATGIVSNDVFRVYSVSVFDLLEFGKNYDESNGIPMVDEYVGDKWGGKYLRAPDIYFTILRKSGVLKQNYEHTIERERESKVGAAQNSSGRSAGLHNRSKRVLLSEGHHRPTKLVRLGDIADVRFGIKTGANEFFYLKDITETMNFNEIKNNIKNLGDYKTLGDIKTAGLRIVQNDEGSYWLIEEEFLKQVIKSPRESKTILIKPEDLKYKIFMCSKNKDELKNTNAIKYIEWGEKKGFNKIPSVKTRKNWWSLGLVNSSIIWPSTYNPELKVFYNPEKLPIDKVLYGIDGDIKILASLSSFLFLIQTEIMGYPLVGGGGLFLTVDQLRNLYVVNPEILPKNIINQKYYRKISRSIFQECGINPESDVPIERQDPNPLPDRAALDKIVFDALGLTEEERKDVYRAVCRLVWNRLSKAKSF